MIGLMFPNLSGKKRVFSNLSLAIIPALVFVLLGIYLPLEIQETYNAMAWIGSNVLLAYSGSVLVIFLMAYFYYFDPRATTGGRLIFQFMISLVGIIFLNVIGIFINPTANNAWYVYPEHVDPWRPTVRLVIYGFVAYSITSLAVLLVMRKWFPDKLKKASDITLVKPRNEEDTAVVDPITPKTTTNPIIRKNPVIPTDLIEDTWPQKRGEKN